MTGTYHVWFGGRRNQLSTPTFDYGMVFSDLNVGILYLFVISSLGVYGIITAGWSNNSKYVFLGALRSAAQMVSYEVSIGLIIITVLIYVGSCNFSFSCFHALCQARQKRSKWVNGEENKSLF